MKKNLDFIDKTNWMFTQDNFDIHFLNKYVRIFIIKIINLYSIDPKTIEDNQSYIYYDTNNIKGEFKNEL